VMNLARRKEFGVASSNNELTIIAHVRESTGNSIADIGHHVDSYVYFCNIP
jgi:hypothetical protein